MISTKKRVRRDAEQLIRDLEAKIVSIRARAERKKVKADPAMRHTAAAVKAIDKALAETKDATTRQALGEARSTLSACLALNGVGGGNGAVVKPHRARGSGGFDDASGL